MATVTLTCTCGLVYPVRDGRVICPVCHRSYVVHVHVLGAAEEGQDT